MKKILFSYLQIILIICSTSAFAISPEPVVAKYGMVVSEQKLASEAGAEILKEGGNAIDAAVAVGYALAVVDPCCGNIGGGGFMLIHLATGANIFLNFREKAPLAATSSMYINNQGQFDKEKSLYGYLAVAVPGTVLGLDTALKKYGTMTRAQVIAPAIRLAQKGFIIGSTNAKLFARYQFIFLTQPDVAAIFLNHGIPYLATHSLKDPDLADTLKLIAKEGALAFYKGPIAEAIVKASKANGGILSLEDFAKYNVTESPALICHYKGYTIATAKPPSAGGIGLCEMLNLLEPYPLTHLGFHSAQSIHYLVEAMRLGFFDHNRLGDPVFVNNPVNLLISKKYAQELRNKIQSLKATASSDIGSGVIHEGQQTTHFSVADQYGNAVATTYTLNSFFGAKVIAGHTGFLLNDSMNDFTAKSNTANQFHLIQGIANIIQPGKRPLSSMTPTIVLKNKHIFMVLGSPGGPRIITSVLQTLLNVIDYNMNIQEAVDAPRIHHQWQPDIVDYEPFALSQDSREKLEKMGYSLLQQDNWSAIAAILIDPTTHLMYGANDDRRPNGAAIGVMSH